MTINEVMENLYIPWRYRWCSAMEEPLDLTTGRGMCACMGCCNQYVKAAGFTKQDWEQWVQENPKEG
jgi:hypothetical protein